MEVCAKQEAKKASGEDMKAAALRENLRKRKLQAQSRAVVPPDHPKDKTECP